MVALFGTFNNQCTFFCRGSADDVHFSRIISYDGTLAVFWIKPPLRLSGTSPQGEAFEGSCRESRLRGGIKFSNISKGMLIASLNTEMF
jgi:hypothetical protein